MSGSLPKRSGALLPLAVLAFAVVGGVAAYLITREPALPPPDPALTSTDCHDDVRVVFETKRFCPGNRIVTTQYAGSLKPAETGYPIELRIDAGHTATVTGNAPSPVTGQPALAKVEWDAQVWEDMEGRKVERPVIVDTIHADHINFLR